MKIKKINRPAGNFWLLPGMFLIIFLVLLSFLLYYHHNQQERIKNEKYAHLQALSNLKIEKIKNWLKEREGEARFTYYNKGFTQLVADMIRNPGDVEMEKKVEEWLQPMKESHDYVFISFITPEGERYVKSNGSMPVCPMQIDAAIAAGKEGAIVMGDFVLDQESGKIFMDMFVPVLHVTGLLGTVIFRIDPYTEFYPLIQSIILPSRSLEIILVKREHGEVVILNELRHLPNVLPMTLKYKVDNGNPATVETTVNEGTIMAKDYRGVEVLADLRKVPGFEWMIVTKIDIDEIFEPLITQRNQLMMMIFLVSASVALSFFFLINNRQSKFYKELYQKERDKKALVKHFEYLKRHANDPIFLMKPDGTIIDVNQRALQNYGYTEQELLGMNITEVRAPEKRADLEIQMKKVIESNGYVFKTRHLKKDGTTFPVEVSARHIALDGQVYFHSIVRDITERTEAEKKIRELNRELISARDTAEESSKLKSVILMNMSHELRTPLNGILGFSHLLHNKLKGTPDENMINHIMVSGDRLLNTLTNIMELAQLESENAQVNLDQFRLNRIINEVIPAYEHLARKKNLFLRNNINSDFPVRADRTMLLQTLGHLFDNAIKFTETGGITITADQVTNSGVLFTRVQVTDTGIGIPFEDAGNIFMEFRQLSQGYKRHYEGSGIGLSLVKKMVVLMNGSITVESNPGEGSVFTMSLPSGDMNESVIMHKPKLQDHNQAGKPVNHELPEVLVVEDNTVNAQLITAYLKNKVRIEHASDGKPPLKWPKRKNMISCSWI
jgi:PAS domain S-box-containing protein